MSEIVHAFSWPKPKPKPKPHLVILFRTFSVCLVHWPSGLMLSISRNVLLSVCPSVRLSICLCSLLRYRWNVFLPPLPEVGCPIFLEIRNPWGKVMERSGLRLEHFWCGSGLKLLRQKKFVFLVDFALQNMVETTLPNGLETSGQRAYRKFWHISRRFWVFAFLVSFSVFKKIRFLGFLCPPRNHTSRWIRDLWSKGVSLILAYFKTFLSFWVLDDFSCFSKKSGVRVFFVQQNMVETTLPDGLETSGWRAYR